MPAMSSRQHTDHAPDHRPRSGSADPSAIERSTETPEHHPEHATAGVYVSPGKPFTRDMTYIDDRIVADPQTTPRTHADQQLWPVEAGRYRLVAAQACPWANRTLIVRRLLGLEDALSLGLAGPVHDENSWTFDLDPGGVDPVLGIERLQQAYFARFPDYPRGITVPAIVEIDSGEVVTNDFNQMTLDFSTEWTAHHRDGAPDLYPDALRAEMDELMRWVFTEVNNGVYRCGFAGSQQAYDEAFTRLFTALDQLEARLENQRFLLGPSITEADVRLFTTLARFDVVYYSHFKCNRSQLRDFPALWAYARDLFQLPGFGETIDFAQIKDHYYVVQTSVNPTGIVPRGPDTSSWRTTHGRESLSDRPWGAGTAPQPLS